MYDVYMVYAYLTCGVLCDKIKFIIVIIIILGIRRGVFVVCEDFFVAGKTLYL